MNGISVPIKDALGSLLVVSNVISYSEEKTLQQEEGPCQALNPSGVS